MKFVIVAVVVLAVILGVQSSILGPTLQQGSVIVGGPSAGILGGAVSVDISSGIGIPGATYVAKTLGAVHAAPLPGHTQSASAINVDPAPGSL